MFWLISKVISCPFEFSSPINFRSVHEYTVSIPGVNSQYYLKFLTHIEYIINKLYDIFYGFNFWNIVFDIWTTKLTSLEFHDNCIIK